VQTTELEVDGKPVRYRVAGSGAPVVLVHGLSGSWRWWSAVAEPLAERRCVYVLDLPRLGRRLAAAELAAWLARWLRALDLESVDLVGHSLGGLVAAELAASQPERVRRLVLVAPAGIPCGRGVTIRAVRLAETLWEVRDRFPTVVADALRAGPLGLLHGAVFASVRDLRAELASVHSPSLLVWGEHDRLVPLQVAGEWRLALPQAEFAVLPCGHVPMWEAADELTVRLLEFLDEPGDEAGDELGPGVVDRVRLARDDHEPAAR
jgi:pimeloyl-ACP methyl ester carboxylesterase